MSNEQKQPNKFVAKAKAFFGKFKRKKKSEGVPFESLNIWEQSVYAAAQAEIEEEKARVAVEKAEEARIKAAIMTQAEHAAATAEQNEISGEKSADKKKGKELSPEEAANVAAEVAREAQKAADEQTEKAKQAAQRLIDAKAAVSQAAVNWEEYRKSAAERLTRENELVKKEQAQKSKAEKEQRAAVQIAADSAVSETEPTEPQATEGGEAAVLYKEMSPTRMLFRRFFRSRLSLVGLVMLVVLFLFSFLGPPVFHMFGYNWGEVTIDTTRTLNTNVVLVEAEDEAGNKVESYQIIESYVDLNAKAAPSAKHLLGTDERGMDIFIRLMYGGRISLTLGFVVVILETIIGIIMGGLAGYFGGWVDQVIMRIVDILNCIPTLPILLIASAVLTSFEIPGQSNIYFLMLILTVFGWSGTARMVRGQILYLREQEYIVACEVMGIPTWRRIFLHLIPNIMPQLIVSMTLGLGSIILYESTLSYLGLGVPKPYAAWGTMISSASDQIMLVYYPNFWIPAGILIIIAVLGFNFVGDGLRDAMDPKSKR